MEQPEIIFENADFVVVNKPAGLLVHGVRVSAAKKIDEARRHEPTLADWLVARYPEMGTVGDDPELRPGIVHRLDKETSGVMIAARTQASFEALKSLFQSREMKKTYAALVFGIPKEEKGIIDRPIGIKNGTLKRSVHVTAMAKPAVTEYRVKEKYRTDDTEGKTYSLLEVHPRTGRTHQIRVHLASMGHPIVGDRLYGHGRRTARAVRREAASSNDAAPRLMLHAEALEFSDRAGNRFAFEVPLPEDFLKVIHSFHA